MIWDNPVILGLLLSFLAGASTTIGALIAFFVKKPTDRFLSMGLGFSAGIMIAVSFFELLSSSILAIGLVSAGFGFFVGMIFIFIIDLCIPHFYEVEESDPVGHGGHGHRHRHLRRRTLMRLSVLTAVGIAIHNFPEGFVVFAGTLHSLQVGLVLAIAIAMHNIPEGISVSVPVFCATGDRKKAFKYSFLSGISEPIGALFGMIFLLPFLSVYVVNWALAFAAGVMVYISFDELLPAAHKYGKEHSATFGVILGMLLMVVTIVLLNFVSIS
ncbi:MAG: zinc transporter ZupT [Candidatus Aenigmarchaeota archaeon]